MNAPADSAVLDRVFGPGSDGDTLRERAAISAREFVRGQTMLAEASESATGRRLAAFEALEIFGFEILRRAVEEGQAAIVPDRNEPSRTLRERREELGLTIERFARLLGVRMGDVVQAETPGKVSPIRLLDKLAPSLAIDERFLGFDSVRSVDAALGVRFRRLSDQDKSQGLPHTSVMRLAEAAWVIARQKDLMGALQDQSSLLKAFTPNSDYAYPAYQKGFSLAAETRKRLGLMPDEPIKSLRRLIEDTLGIPVVKTDLGQILAGATIANGDRRGIVVNMEGRNENPWIRRMTLAHELGHLLWDPAERLESLMVDRYAEIEGQFTRPQDPVEIRANAFAIALLAPPCEVERMISEHAEPWAAIVAISERFGVSVTASRNHVQNIGHFKVTSGTAKATVSDEWKAQENYTNDFFPIKSTPLSRRGRFAGVVLRAQQRKLISLDSAATFLGTDVETLGPSVKDILELTV